MSNRPDDFDHARLEAIGRLAAPLRPLLRDGESRALLRKGDDVRIARGETDGPSSAIRRSHPELFGRLLSVNERIGTAGSWTAVLPVVGGPLLAVATHVRLLDLILAGIGASSWCERRVYRAERAERLTSDLAAAGLTVRRALALLEGDEAVKHVAQALKRDADAVASSAAGATRRVP